MGTAVVNITTLINDRIFFNEFQPISNSSNDSIFAYEAFIRTSPKINPEKIFQYGRNCGQLFKFDTAAVSNAIKEFPSSYLKKYYLFVNVFPSTIIHSDFPEFINSLLKNYPEIEGRIVFEINEDILEERFWHNKEFMVNLHFLKSIGFRIAFDDLPLSEFSITKIIKFRPHFAKLDRVWSEKLSDSKDKQEKMALLLAYSHKKMLLVLEGIETVEDLVMAKSIGVPLLQGYFIAKPHRL